MYCPNSRLLTIVLYVLNFLIAIGAIVLLSFGAAYTVKENNGVKIFGSSFFVAMAMTLGCLVLVATIFGCVATFIQRPKLLRIYGVILMSFFALQLALGIMAVEKIDNREAFLHHVRNSVQDLFEEDGLGILEKKFECCGVQSYNDYNITTSYPPSCCQNEASPCVRPFEVGCASAFGDEIEPYIRTIGWVSIVFAVTEVLGGILAFVIRNKSATCV